MPITVEVDAVVDGPGDLNGRDLFLLLFAPRTVEAVLPADDRSTRAGSRAISVGDKAQGPSRRGSDQA